LDTLATVNIGMLLFGLLVVAGIVSSLVAERMGAPLLLFFLAIGMLAGEDGPGGIEFDDFELTYVVGSLALAIILFDGGLRMRLKRFRSAFGPAVLLATVGVLVTAGITGLAAMVFLRLSPPEGLLIGSIVASTDAAAVLFLLGAGGLLLRRRIGATLEIEAGANDPTAVMLTLLLVQIVGATATRTGGGEIASFLGQQIAYGGVAGLLGGFAIVTALNRLWLPAGLPPLFVVASAVTIFGLAATLGGSGFLAVYVAGLVVGNRPVRAFPAVLRFHDAATWLAQIVMFIVLGLLVTPSRLVEHLGAAVVISAVLMLIARPAAVWLCLTPFGFNVKEKVFISWVGLRGAVSIFLAAIPILAGAPNAIMYFDVAFVVVLVSLMLQGWTIAPAARWAGVARTDAAPSINRVEIDLPGRLDLEMVGYPVQAESYVLARGRLPRWLRPMLVLRKGDALAAVDAGPLEAGDFAYFLAPRNRLRLLDRIFSPFDAAEAARGDGLFSFRGGVKLDEVAGLYGVQVSADLAGKTVAEAFAVRFAGAPEVGDRIDLGRIALISAAATAEGVTVAYLDLEPRAASTGSVATAAVRRFASQISRVAKKAVRRPKKPAPEAGPAPQPPAAETAAPPAEP
jgi:cell volume regulation protein A